MRGTIVLASAALVLLTPALAGATANYVYHEQTTNVPGGTCPAYLSDPAPGPSDAYGLAFKIEYQFYTDNADVYYTTDGSTPAGAFGVASGTTNEINATYACTFVFGGNTIDVATASIPAQPAGTTVNYIVSGWHTGGGPEVFANSGSCNASTCATVFSYTVSTPTPDAGADAASEAGVDAEIEAAADAAAEAGSEAEAPDAGVEAAADAGVDAETDASAEASVDSGVTADAGGDAGTDGAVAADTGAPADARADAPVADTGSMTGQDATMMSEAGGADSSMGGSPDATASVDSSDDASEPNFAIPGNDNGCGCSLPGGPADFAGGAVGLYALLALVARVRGRRRK